jgi:thiamine-monophosphate kinase
MLSVSMTDSKGQKLTTPRGTRLSELSLIRSIRKRAQTSGRGVAFGIGDDCALIRPRAGEQIAATTDFSLENVHFRRDWHPPESVGHRCLARGLSDLAAMGARPVGALLSLALPPDLTASGDGGPSWVERFMDGFFALAAAHKVPLIGGDTAQSPGQSSVGEGGLALADVVLLGSVQRPLLRSGAKAGDLIYVTGTLGGAAAELLALERDPVSFRGLNAATDGHPHLYPEPRIAVGLRLASLATSAIDLSDGLSTDLRHVCEESGLAAEIHDLPVHSLALEVEAKDWATSAVGLALDGGEDYELLFTASPRTKVPAKIAGVPIHCIGEMKPTRRGRAPIQMRVNGRKAGGRLVPVEPQGWEHFRQYKLLS